MRSSVSREVLKFIFALPFASSKDQLPSIPAVYFVNQISNGKIVYIGKTTMLRHRWNTHHYFNAKMRNYKIHWLECEETEGQTLAETEAFFILALKPALNKEISFRIPLNAGKSVNLYTTNPKRRKQHSYDPIYIKAEYVNM